MVRLVTASKAKDEHNQPMCNLLNSADRTVSGGGWYVPLVRTFILETSHDLLELFMKIKKISPL
ncbi:hypothetical protein KKF84_10615, partial [Myxococcota bacterium]|nr:hypothetical protein [Myxococcota bacterium]